MYIMMCTCVSVCAAQGDYTMPTRRKVSFGNTIRALLHRPPSQHNQYEDEDDDDNDEMQAVHCTW